MYNSSDQRTVSGFPVKPLTFEWLQSAGNEEENGVKPTFYKIDDPENNDSNKPFLLLQEVFDGIFRTMWVDPNNPTHRAFIAEDYDEALRIAAEKLNEGPEDAYLLEDYALALSFKGRHEEALEIFTRLAEEHSDNLVHLHNAGVQLFALGRFEEHLEIQRRILSADKDNVGAHIELLIHHHLKEPQGPEYSAQLEKVLSLSPRDHEEAIMLSNIRAGFDMNKDSYANVSEPEHAADPVLN